jgi:hypothetical protein
MPRVVPKQGLVPVAKRDCSASMEENKIFLLQRQWEPMTRLVNVSPI